LPFPEPRRSQALLAAWAVLAFALSALTDLRALGVAGAAALLLFRRGARRALRRVAVAVLPITVGLSAASWLMLRLVADAPPAVVPFLSLSARTALIAFVTFSVLDRVQLLRALAPFPTLGRLLVLTLAQIHALRLLASESALGLRSRLPRKPGTRDLVRNAGAVTAALFTLSTRNARDIGDAMRSRGFR
jgi:cobalt/nickel transport system permease protein